MGTIKTTVSNDSVFDFIARIPDEQRRADGLELLKLFTSVTHQEAKLWGTSIIGFGVYHYKSERSRQEGDWPLIGFSPRKQALSLYIMTGFDLLSDLLDDLGKHSLGKGCLYITKLDDIDRDVLRKIIEKAYKRALSTLV